MVRSVVVPFAAGFVTVLLGIALGFPLLAIIADASGASSFAVGVGPLVVYRFTREGTATSVEMATLGTFVFSVLGGLANLGLRAVMRSALRDRG